MSVHQRTVSSTHPEIWGPPTWRALHLMAEGYPDFPTPPVLKRCVAFLEALPWMLPCESCGYHTRDFLKRYPGGPERIASCRDALRDFLVELHNSVARRTRPGEVAWSPEKAARVYASGARGTLPYPLEWSSGSRLVRNLVKQEINSDGKESDLCSCSPPASPR